MKLNNTLLAGVLSLAFLFSMVNTADAKLLGADANYRAQKNVTIYQKPKHVSNKNIFVDPKPNNQTGPKHQQGNEYVPNIEHVQKYRPGYVYYSDKECWINISVVPAIEIRGREMYLYYISTNKQFIVHFRSPNEAIAAQNILMKGLDCELPPYYVSEE